MKDTFRRRKKNDDGGMVRERMNVILSLSTQQYQAHHEQKALGPGVLLYVSEKNVF